MVDREQLENSLTVFLPLITAGWKHHRKACLKASPLPLFRCAAFELLMMEGNLFVYSNDKECFLPDRVLFMSRVFTEVSDDKYMPTVETEANTL